VLTHCDNPIIVIVIVLSIDFSLVSHAIGCMDVGDAAGAHFPLLQSRQANWKACGFQQS